MINKRTWDMPEYFIRSKKRVNTRNRIVLDKKEEESRDVISSAVQRRSWSDWDIYITVPDIHGHLRDPQSFELCMATVDLLAKTNKLKEVIQLGDIIDCSEISRHGRSHISDKEIYYEDEIKWARTDFWGRIKKMSPSTKQVQLLGNHEYRLNDYLVNQCKMPQHRAEDVYEKICIENKLKADGIHVVPYATSIGSTQNKYASQSEGFYHITPNLLTIHGWCYGRNASRDHLNKVEGKSVIFGHTHRFDSVIDGLMISGDTRGAWSFGSLALNNMSYNKGAPNAHTNGFGIVYVKGSVFKVDPINILKDGKHKLVVLPQFGEELRI